MGVIFFYMLENILPGKAGHLHVCYDHIHFGLFQKGQGCFGVVQGRGFIAGVFKHGLKYQQVVFFIVQNKDVALFNHNFFL